MDPFSGKLCESRPNAPTAPHNEGVRILPLTAALAFAVAFNSPVISDGHAEENLAPDGTTRTDRQGEERTTEPDLELDREFSPHESKLELGDDYITPPDNVDGFTVTDSATPSDETEASIGAVDADLVGLVDLVAETQPSDFADAGHIPDEYLIGPDADASQLPESAEISDLGGGWRLVSIDDTGVTDAASAMAVATDLADSTGAEVVPNTLLTLADDPLFSDQWALRNVGQSGGTRGADINVRLAWSATRGSANVVVAVLDSGIDLGHPDLASQLWRNGGESAGTGRDDDGNGYVDDIRGWDFIDDDPVPADTTGHGTAVSGIIAAAANGVGITGVAPGVRIMPIRVCDTVCPLSAIVKGLNYAADNGADVVNMSFTGAGEFFQPIADVLEGKGAGMVAVAAAGNDGIDIDVSPRYPASFRLGNLLAVAATDHHDRLASFSNYGRRTVDVAAPGASVLTTGTNRSYRTGSGTSFASPHVAGLAALMISILPNASASNIAGRIRNSAAKKSWLSGTIVSGGRLDAGATVAASFTFTDTLGSVFAADIAWLAASGITLGCNPPANTQFCPNRQVTRGQFAAMMRRALDLPAGPDVFGDDSGSVFEADINALAAAGIAKGCNPPANTRFCPDAPVSRGQMASFLTRALTLPSATSSFVDTRSSVHAGPIGSLAAAGITHGCNPPKNDHFCPDDSVTRGQMAAFLHRADP